MDKYEKLEKLKSYISDCGSLVVAFSGGVDSTFLLKVAHDVLGKKAAAVTSRSPLVSEREWEEARAFCHENGMIHFAFDFDPCGTEAFMNNPPDRCYLCKKEIFGQIVRIAASNGYAYVAEGSNVDDLGDYRPGMRAIEEMKVLSPLREAGLTKQEIRELSKEMGLPTWNKPSKACLASRFVYGEAITEEKLKMVAKAEEYLAELGLRQYRVRIHGTLARVEAESSEFERLVSDELRSDLVKELKSLGFSYVTLDLQGYRTGSMNEVLKDTEAER